jgi:hypothetical protein
MELKKIEEILTRHVPASAVEYCTRLWQDLPFHFKLRKSRQSKVGDFTCRTGHTPQITVNHDLHPYLFLMTYVHEVAHHRVHQQYGHRAEAHGTEWKKNFQELMSPLLTGEIFPEPLLSGLIKHMSAPKASSFADAELTQLFRAAGGRADEVLLSHIPEGSIFHLQGRWFKKGKLRRTRVLCREVKSKRQYLVPLDAVISEAQLSLL